MGRELAVPEHVSARRSRCPVTQGPDGPGGWLRDRTPTTHPRVLPLRLRNHSGRTRHDQQRPRSGPDRDRGHDVVEPVVSQVRDPLMGLDGDLPAGAPTVGKQHQGLAGVILDRRSLVVEACCYLPDTPRSSRVIDRVREPGQIRVSRVVCVHVEERGVIGCSWSGTCPDGGRSQQCRCHQTPAPHRKSLDHVHHSSRVGFPTTAGPHPNQGAVLVRSQKLAHHPAMRQPTVGGHAQNRPSPTARTPAGNPADRASVAGVADELETGRLEPPRPVWMSTSQFCTAADVQPGSLSAWVRDTGDTPWRAEVWCLRENLPRDPTTDPAPRDRRARPHTPA